MIARLLVLTAVSLMSGDVLGCSCVRNTTAERIDEAEFVGVIRVGTVELNPEYSETLRPGGDRGVASVHLASFEVLEVMRGDPAAFAHLEGGYGGGDCGLPLLPGKDFLIAATPHDGAIEVSYCGFSVDLGPRSLLEESNGPYWTREEVTIDAVRRYVTDGIPLDECADPSGLLLPEAAVEKELRCRPFFEAHEKAFKRAHSAE